MSDQPPIPPQDDEQNTGGLGDRGDFDTDEGDEFPDFMAGIMGAGEPKVPVIEALQPARNPLFLLDSPAVLQRVGQESAGANDQSQTLAWSIIDNLDTNIRDDYFGDLHDEQNNQEGIIRYYGLVRIIDWVRLEHPDELNNLIANANNPDEAGKALEHLITFRRRDQFAQLVTQLTHGLSFLEGATYNEDQKITVDEADAQRVIQEGLYVLGFGNLDDFKSFDSKIQGAIDSEPLSGVSAIFINSIALPADHQSMVALRKALEGNQRFPQVQIDNYIEETRKESATKQLRDGMLNYFALCRILKMDGQALDQNSQRILQNLGINPNKFQYIDLENPSVYNINYDIIK